MRIDLHSHSSRSDGKESVSQVFEAAKQERVDILALTDHDTASGWAEATAVAQRLGMGFVPGIEVTTKAHFHDADGSMQSFSVHMLAYLVNPEEPDLATTLTNSLEGRKKRILEMVDVIAPDYPITLDDVLGGLDEGATQGRPAIADALMKRGYFDSREAVFAEIWGKHQNRRYYIPNRGTPDTIDAIKLIRGAGGVPVIAHPLGRSGNRSGSEDLKNGYPRDHFVQMIEAGLAGFEVEHREVDQDARNWLRDLAREFDLVTTGSSDYHGRGGKPNRLGENTTTPAMLEKILEQGRGSSAIL